MWNNFDFLAELKIYQCLIKTRVCVDQISVNRLNVVILVFGGCYDKTNQYFVLTSVSEPVYIFGAKDSSVI